MSPLALFILALVVLFPIGWIIGESKNKPMVRRVCGIGAFVFALLVGVIVGLLQRLQYNADYSFSSKELFEQTVLSLKNEKTDEVLKQYEKLSEVYSPTYENRANFDEVVNAAAESLKKEASILDDETKEAAQDVTPNH
ncbi:MAG: hypothetical protein ABF377_08335 [Akkermansiaceae bacterium]